MQSDNDNPEVTATAPLPPDAADDGSAGAMTGGMDMCVPLDSLKEPDEQQQMQSPEVGNNVVMTVEGTISRIDGQNAYVTPSAVNGQKLDQMQGNQAPEGDQLRQMAGAMPAGNYGQ